MWGRGRKPLELKKCLRCGQEFQANKYGRRIVQVYCSSACQKAASIDKKYQGKVKRFTRPDTWIFPHGEVVRSTRAYICWKDLI